MRRTVLIFRYELLPASETFIKAQAGALAEFQPCYTGVERVVKGLPIPDDSILLMNGKPIRDRVERRAFLSAGWAPIFTRRLRERTPALIHAHFAPDGAIALPLASQLGVPLIVTLHGYDVTSSEEFLKRGHGSIYLKRKHHLFERASLFICVSEFIKQKAMEVGFPESKLRVHYIGVDRRFFRPALSARERDLVLFVGRLVEKKGCAYLIEAMELVQKKCADARLVIIGDGPLRQSLETLARQKTVACEFLGSQPVEIVREWIGRARVLCVPSVTAANGDSEGLPTVLMEGQAMGVPAVSTVHAGIPEIIRDGETGLLATERDHKNLAAHILRYLEDDSFWSRCSDLALQGVQERFDLQRQTARLEDIYTDLVGT